MPNSLAELLTETAGRHADRPALKLDDAVLNYAILNEGATRIAGLLKEKGLQPGERVGIMLPNVPYFAVAYYGILRAGGVVVPMNVLLKGREVAFYLKDSGAKVLFAWHDFGEAAEDGAAEAGTELILVKPGEFEQLVMDAPRAPEDEPREGSDTAVILYTSGTTGTPKGAELTHDNLRENCTVTAQHARADHRGRRDPRRAAAVSLLRPDVRAQRGRRERRLPDADPALRPRQGAGDHRPRPGDDPRGRADDVPRDAQHRTTRPRTSRSCGCASPAARRCRSRS